MYINGERHNNVTQSHRRSLCTHSIGGQFHPTTGIVVLVQKYHLPLQGTEAQFCCLPASRQVALPTELSAASIEDRRGEYAVMKKQMTVESLRIRNFTVRRKR